MPLMIANARRFSYFEYDEVLDISRMILIEAISEYDQNKGTFGNFLKQKLYYYFLDQSKKQRPMSLDQVDHEGGAIVDSLESDYDLEEELVNKEKYKNLYSSIDKLPDDLKAIVIDKYFLGMTNGQIAEKMGLSYKTIANKSTMALKKLRKSLTELL